MTASNGTSPGSGTGIYNLTAGSYSYILSDAMAVQLLPQLQLLNQLKLKEPLLQFLQVVRK
ncbi:MAG: hypothetical protein IPH33_19575 [Bacteroidetes bacterium]|nr:hypothetical protein [Bacteroidota bacterium]